MGWNAFIPGLKETPKVYWKTSALMRRIDRELSARMRWVHRYLGGGCSRREYEHHTAVRPGNWKTSVK